MHNKDTSKEEMLLEPISGFVVLVDGILGIIVSIVLFVLSIIRLDQGGFSIVWFAVMLVSAISWVVIPILFFGLKAINPNEAAVYVLFGKYYGTIAKEGLYFINPFCFATNPTKRKKISLKAITHNNKLKLNDNDGNPIDVSMIVIWRVINPTKAVFEVDNYKDYISVQSDAALRQAVRKYPYYSKCNEKSLHGSSGEVADELKIDLQSRVEIAGIEVVEIMIC